MSRYFWVTTLVLFEAPTRHLLLTGIISPNCPLEISVRFPPPCRGRAREGVENVAIPPIYPHPNAPSLRSPPLQGGRDQWF